MRARPYPATLCVLACVVFGVTPAQSRDAPASFHEMAAAKLPAVVSVQSTRQSASADEGARPQGKVPQGLQDFLDRFLGDQESREGLLDRFRGERRPSRPMQALGSGFIISTDGYVVTNNHVVEKSSAVSVHLGDGRELTAKVVGLDPQTDLALLKVDAGEPLPRVEWGDSDNAKVGDWVLAVGAPFGLGGTVTAGIVSARARDIHAGPYDDFIQTDASINTGNSGGPLFDMSGKVVGVNTAIFSPVGANIGIGFAIPAAMAQPIVRQLRETGEVKRGWLGVQIQAVTPDVAEALDLEPPRGAIVAQVTEGSPAAKAGIEVGDVILSFAGSEVEKLRDLPAAVAQAPIGKPAEVAVWRDGERITVNPEIARLQPNETEHAAAGRPQADKATLGLALAPLTPENRRQYGVGEDQRGALVTDVSPDGPAARSGMRRGDVIVRVGRDTVASPQDVADALRKARDNGRDRVLILRQRDDTQQFVAVPVPPDAG
ncbi:MAG: DegQ family serine endoprotease [Rhodospirillaceae bacterium]